MCLNIGMRFQPCLPLVGLGMFEDPMVIGAAVRSVSLISCLD